MAYASGGQHAAPCKARLTHRPAATGVRIPKAPLGHVLGELVCPHQKGPSAARDLHPDQRRLAFFLASPSTQRDSADGPRETEYCRLRLPARETSPWANRTGSFASVFREYSKASSFGFARSETARGVYISNRWLLIPPRETEFPFFKKLRIRENNSLAVSTLK